MSLIVNSYTEAYEALRVTLQMAGFDGGEAVEKFEVMPSRFTVRLPINSGAVKTYIVWTVSCPGVHGDVYVACALIDVHLAENTYYATYSVSPGGRVPAVLLGPGGDYTQAYTPGA